MTSKTRTDAPTEATVFDFKKATLDKGFELTLNVSNGDNHAHARLSSLFVDLKINDNYFMFTQGITFLKTAQSKELTDDYLFGNLLGKGLVSHDAHVAAGKVSDTLKLYPGIDITGMSNGLINFLEAGDTELSVEDYRAIVDTAFDTYANKGDSDYDNAKRALYRLGRKRSSIAYEAILAIKSLKAALDENDLYDLWTPGVNSDPQPQPVSFSDKSGWDNTKGTL